MEKSQDQVVDLKKEFKVAFDDWQDLYLTFEKALNREQIELGQSTVALAQSVEDPDLRQSIISINEEARYRIRHEKTSMMRSAILLMIYSFMERYARKIVTTCGVKTQKPDYMKPFKSALLDLSKEKGVSIPTFFDQELELIAELRHAFAHQTGFLNKDKITRVNERKQGLNTLGLNPLLDFKTESQENGYHEITLGITFIPACFSKLKAAFNELFENAREKLK